MASDRGRIDSIYALIYDYANFAVRVGNDPTQTEVNNFQTQHFVYEKRNGAHPNLLFRRADGDYARL